MPSFPPPIGSFADTRLAFDNMALVLGLTGIAMVAGLSLLLWAIRARDRVRYRLRCPEHGTEAIIEVRMPRADDGLDIEKCSLCNPPTRVDARSAALDSSPEAWRIMSILARRATSRRMDRGRRVGRHG